MSFGVRNNFTKRIAVVIGTRPEAVKLAPVIKALTVHSKVFEPVVIVTAQHRQMLDQVLSVFAIRPDVDLGVMQERQSLNGLTAKVLSLMEETLSAVQPDVLLVQGDTTTAFASALAAFNLKIAVGHIEAGLRSHDLYNPFPEEINRRLTSNLSTIHFAPTSMAMRHLREEGVARERIVVTGNTVVDAVGELLNAPFSFEVSPLRGIDFKGKRTVLVTSHRRESWGRELESICLAVEDIVERFHDVQVVFPVHMNPRVSATVFEILGSVPRVRLTEPLDYLTFINLMKRSFMILTDSGGIQEEAPTMRKPLLVLRKLTERPEAFLAGLAKIVGTTRESIVAEAARLLSETDAYNNMISEQNPYGDGHASERIVTALQRWALGSHDLLTESEEFGEGSVVMPAPATAELMYAH
jgi:UDP-N-acetylglucosamine 2-epimerase (non-hydrolysing)